MLADEKNGHSLGVITGYGRIAKAWGPNTTARQAAYMAAKGVIRVDKEPGGRAVHTTIDRLRDDRDRLMAGLMAAPPRYIPLDAFNTLVSSAGDGDAAAADAVVQQMLAKGVSRDLVAEVATTLASFCAERGFPALAGHFDAVVDRLGGGG